MESKINSVTKIRQWETMAVFALLCLLLGVRSQRQSFVFLAMGFLIVALFVPSLARIIALGWLKLSMVLAHVNNRIILTLMFYLILTPIACFYRLFHNDPLGLAMKKSGSYYCERNHTYSRTDLEKLW